MTFVNVMADECNAQGSTSPQIPKRNLQIHKDLIAAFIGNEVIPKSGDILTVGGKHYKNIRLADGVKIESL